MRVALAMELGGIDAALVIGAGTAYEGLDDRGRLQAGETVLITAAAGGVGSAAVQIAAAMGARPLGVASPPNHDYLRSLGASEVFDYHAADWVQQVRAAVPGGVDQLLDCTGGHTRDQAIGAVRDGGRAISIVFPGPPAQLERGITGESFAAHVTRRRLEALRRLVDTGRLRPQVQAVLPLDQARQALAQVAGRHTRGEDRAGNRAVAATPQARSSGAPEWQLTCWGCYPSRWSASRIPAPGIAVKSASAAGAVIGSAPDRSLRVTRIAATAMISASRPTAAENRKPREKPTASACAVICFCAAAVNG